MPSSRRLGVHWDALVAYAETGQRGVAEIAPNGRRVRIESQRLLDNEQPEVNSRERAIKRFDRIRRLRVDE
jgi:hypothetical protein